jgi:hypothetical protein
MIIRAMTAILCCILLSSCETLKNIQSDEKLNAIGSFKLNPVQPNTYWYNGSSYEYNEYEIEFTSDPVRSHVQWDGKPIGTTPFVYRFSGVLDKDEYVNVRATPIDESLPAQEAKLKVRTELPRKIHFDL